LFYRKSAQRDIVIGTPFAGRVLRDLEPQVGPYLNVLPLRDEVAGSDRFDTLLERVRDTSIEAFSNPLYPLEWLLDELKIERVPERNPVFDIGFTLQNQRREPSARHAGSVQISELPSGITQFMNAEALTYFWFLAEPSADGLRFDIVYDSARFSDTYVRALARELTSIVDEALENPGIRLRNLSLGHTVARIEPIRLALELESF
jgi:non-ribosomal peptide synthetase component F